jgi:hypothetical protein
MSYSHHVKPTVRLSDYTLSATTMTKGSIQLHELSYFLIKTICDAGRLDDSNFAGV